MALVTGGTSSIGCAVSCQLVALGATVVITMQDIVQAKKAAAAMSSARGVRAVGASLDLMNLTEVQRLANK